MWFHEQLDTTDFVVEQSKSVYSDLRKESSIKNGNVFLDPSLTFVNNQNKNTGVHKNVETATISSVRGKTLNQNLIVSELSNSSDGNYSLFINKKKINYNTRKSNDVSKKFSGTKNRPINRQFLNRQKTVESGRSLHSVDTPKTLEYHLNRHIYDLGSYHNVVYVTSNMKNYSGSNVKDASLSSKGTVVNMPEHKIIGNLTVKQIASDYFVADKHHLIANGAIYKVINPDLNIVHYITTMQPPLTTTLRSMDTIVPNVTSPSFKIVFPLLTTNETEHTSTKSLSETSVASYTTDKVENVYSTESSAPTSFADLNVFETKTTPAVYQTSTTVVAAFDKDESFTNLTTTSESITDELVKFDTTGVVSTTSATKEFTIAGISVYNHTGTHFVPTTEIHQSMTEEPEVASNSSTTDEVITHDTTTGGIYVDSSKPSLPTSLSTVQTTETVFSEDLIKRGSTLIEDNINNLTTENYDRSSSIFVTENVGSLGTSDVISPTVEVTTIKSYSSIETTSLGETDSSPFFYSQTSLTNIENNSFKTPSMLDVSFTTDSKSPRTESEILLFTNGGATLTDYNNSEATNYISSTNAVNLETFIASDTSSPVTTEISTSQPTYSTIPNNYSTTPAYNIYDNITSIKSFATETTIISTFSINTETDETQSSLQPTSSSQNFITEHVSTTEELSSSSDLVTETESSTISQFPQEFRTSNRTARDFRHLDEYNNLSTDCSVQSNYPEIHV